ncbi:MAG: His-Xaa-Ser system radical SAM maturase HxsB [Pirellulaceae bacterium]|nr:His-Xaa-Ser system radical SAM maturase HxsB [Pirellulaceae bacterium]
MKRVLLPLHGTTFQSEAAFQSQAGKEYALLPMRFLKLDASRYVMTNMAAEYVIVDKATLHRYVRHELSSDDPAYELLKSRHFLLDADSRIALDLLACKYRTKHSLLSQLTSLFMFVVTLRCEHSCPYCQVSRQSQDRKAFDMQTAHAERAIELMFETPSPAIKVEFQGGEPLLNFELIRWIVERVVARNRDSQKSVSFVITTNLALINDEILEFCADYGVFISTSLDGPRELHNANRPRPGNDSYERTVAGIERVRYRLGGDSVAALMTTTRLSLAQPEAIVDEYITRGFTSIFLRCLSPFGFAVKTGAVGSYSIEEWLIFYRRALAHIIERCRQGVAIREDYAALILRKALTPFPTHYVDLQSPAGIGLACLAFNYDGNIYASDESRMLAEMKDTTFQLGHVEHDSLASVVGSDRLIRLLGDTMSESVPICHECGVQPYCGSDPVYHHATQGDAIGHKPRSGFCRKNMEVIRHLLTLMEDDPSSAEVLRSWIR